MFHIICSKDSHTFVWSYKPNTLKEALSVGHELTRDFVADFFRVVQH